MRFPTVTSISSRSAPFSQLDSAHAGHTSADLAFEARGFHCTEKGGLYQAPPARPVAWTSLLRSAAGFWARWFGLSLTVKARHYKTRKTRSVDLGFEVRGSSFDLLNAPRERAARQGPFTGLGFK